MFRLSKVRWISAAQKSLQELVESVVKARAASLPVDEPRDSLSKILFVSFLCAGETVFQLSARVHHVISKISK